mmetsp:Transcript_26611/g.63114  ORF Transcript_26611/g.63114 Transcript_26611/m.63114 type:complete len:215 (+) Transcript_26611:119-763(+)
MIKIGIESDTPIRSREQLHLRRNIGVVHGQIHVKLEAPILVWRPLRRHNEGLEHVRPVLVDAREDGRAPLHREVGCQAGDLGSDAEHALLPGRAGRDGLVRLAPVSVGVVRVREEAGHVLESVGFHLPNVRRLLLLERRRLPLVLVRVLQVLGDVVHVPRRRLLRRVGYDPRFAPVGYAAVDHLPRGYDAVAHFVRVLHFILTAATAFVSALPA